MKKFLFFFLLCCMPALSYAYKDTFEVEVGQQFTINGGSYRNIQAVLWDFDSAVFDAVNVTGYSTRATFKAISPSPSAGSIIQATIYYYKNGTTSSGVNKDVVAWKVYVADDGSESTVSLPTSLSMDLNTTKIITATTSSPKYSGNYKWQSSNHFIVEVISSSGNSATLRANSVGSTYIHVTLDNGNTDAVYVTVKDTALPTVSASPSSGTYEKGTKIYLTASQSNATIRYTTNGSTPTSSSQKYSSYITLNESFTLKARAYNTSGEAGDILTCNYTVKEDPNNILNYNILSTTDKTVEVVAPATGSYQGDIVIPSSVKIGGIFYTVLKIGNRAFFYCPKLNSVTIPNSVTAIDTLAFSNCHGLTSVTIPNSVTSIGWSAFYFCGGLTSVTIPNSVTSIEECAFSNCGRLKSINVDKSNKNYLDIDGVLYNKNITKLIQCPGALTSVTIPNSVSHIGSHAFDGCRGLTSVTIPNSASYIGSKAFSECHGLTSMTIPNSVSYIGSKAFWNCTGLISVTISNSVTTIGSGAFSLCTDLTAVYYGAENPIKGSSDIFSSYYYNKVTLYVPRSAVEKCKQIDPWKNFSKIEAYNFADIDEMAVDFDCELPYEVYTINGVMLGNSTENLVPGIYIVRQGLKTKKIVVR